MSWAKVEEERIAPFPHVLFPRLAEARTCFFAFSKALPVVKGWSPWREKRLGRRWGGRPEVRERLEYTADEWGLASPG